MIVALPFSKQDGHVRCAAHVFNIAVQEVLKRLHAEAAEHEEECMASGSDVGSLGCVQKLRRLIPKIRASPQRIEELANQCELSGVPKLEALLDVRTRWNSTYKMLQRAEKIRAPLTIVAATDAELRLLLLTEDEWGIVAEICGLLQEFEDVTKMLCASKHPTLTGTIPVYNALIDACEDFADRHTRTEMLREAVDAAKEKLLAYYAKADAAVYPIATIIDPRIKMAYHEREGWEEEWVRDAKAAIQGAFSAYDNATMVQREEVPPKEASETFMARAYKRRHVHRTNELESYLGEEEAEHFPEFDVLQWWRRHSTTYPRLSRMARDYLAVPSTSAPAERAFSKGADLVSAKRGSLSAESIRTSMCLQSWMQHFPSSGKPWLVAAHWFGFDGDVCASLTPSVTRRRNVCSWILCKGVDGENTLTSALHGSGWVGSGRVYDGR